MTHSKQSEKGIRRESVLRVMSKTLMGPVSCPRRRRQEGEASCSGSQESQVSWLSCACKRQEAKEEGQEAVIGEKVFLLQFETAFSVPLCQCAASSMRL